ncbi:hypothetical protein Fmac_002626 [Flemingia macrophylla]|uniref:Uncharacterized protein n=1 Tax=Flemingia macrophylla TaxID=520843 RepID=A0ABD1NKG0_9FABA
MCRLAPPLSPSPTTLCPLHPRIPDLKRLQIWKLPDEPWNPIAELIGEEVHDSEVPELGKAHWNLSAEFVDGQTVPMRSIQVQNMDMPLE